MGGEVFRVTAMAEFTVLSNTSPSVSLCDWWPASCGVFTGGPPSLYFRPFPGSLHLPLLPQGMVAFLQYTVMEEFGLPDFVLGMGMRRWIMLVIEINDSPAPARASGSLHGPTVWDAVVVGWEQAELSLLVMILWRHLLAIYKHTDTVLCKSTPEESDYLC